MIITSSDCYKKYGDPHTEKFMAMWDVPSELEIGVIPRRIYCNIDLVLPLSNAFKSLIETGMVNELKTWDGCFNIRQVRGYENSNPPKMSLHSWGIAIDVNAFENGMGKIGRLSDGFISCFKQNGFDYGGEFSRSDPMHFQLRSDRI
jgi:hypothetical protein